MEISWHMIVAIVVGLYEVICRVIPTVASWSLLGKIIDILAWVSNFLDRRKKK